MPGRLPEAAAACDRVSGLLLRGGFARIAVGDGEIGEVGEILTKRFPERFEGENVLHQRDQVVSPAGIPSGGAEAGLEIFLGTLLSMEADAVVGRILRTRPSRSMSAKSPSAFAIHSAVSGFIERLSVIENLPNERVADSEPLTDLFRSADEQVDRKGGPDGHPNCHRLIHRILVGRHDH